MISGEKIEFKKWVQEQIKSNLIPTFQLKGFKKGRTNCYIRERNEIVQFVTFHLKQEKVRVWGGSSPVYFPLVVGHINHSFVIHGYLHPELQCLLENIH